MPDTFFKNENLELSLAWGICVQLHASKPKHFHRWLANDRDIADLEKFVEVANECLKGLRKQKDLNEKIHDHKI